MHDPEGRDAPLEMTADEFRRIGHALVDDVAEFLESLPGRPVTTAEPPSIIRSHLGDGDLPEEGMDPGILLEETARLLFDHSLFNGHPRFLGYITSSAAPIGILGDLLADAVNPNCGAWTLAPVGTEMERQTVRWIAQMIGYPDGGGGLLVSGGNMANFVGFLAGRRAKAGEDVRAKGVGEHLRVYASTETHTWIQKAADLFGLGTKAIRWIPVDDAHRLDTDALRRAIREDLDEGHRPSVVIAAAGSVSTGAIDPLEAIGAICREHDIWFHVDGAYGAFAAVLPEVAEEMRGMEMADSVALDPHKWLYAPLEAGCTLVRDPAALEATFSYRPPYYKFDAVKGEPISSFVDLGPQNSRGFRALKVWLGLRQVGRKGYERMIRDDIDLARRLYDRAEEHPDLEALACGLSITTFRYVPPGGGDEEYLNRLNREILDRVQDSGEVFISHAVMDGRFVFRTCIVNFRTTAADVDAVPEIIARIGREAHRDLTREV